jgi:hypothetical protein
MDRKTIVNLEKELVLWRGQFGMTERAVSGTPR